MPSTSTDRLNGLTTSVAVKPPCRVATTANLTLRGLQTVDGVVLATDDRVLVKDKNDEADNGIYIVSTSAWSRAPDFDGTLDAVNGTLVIVRAGTVNAGTVWELTTEDPVVIGTSDLTFEPALLTDMATAAFIQAGDDAIERTGQDKLREVEVSAADFEGFDASGEADSSAAVAAAIAALGTGGGTVHIPRGTPRFNVIITTSGVTLKGPGVGRDRLWGDGANYVRPWTDADPCIKVGGSASARTTGVTLQDMTVYGNNTGTIGVYFAQGAFRCSMVNVTAYDFATNNFKFKGGPGQPCSLIWCYGLISGSSAAGNEGVLIDGNVGTYTSAIYIIGGHLATSPSAAGSKSLVVDSCDSVFFSSVYMDASNLKGIVFRKSGSVIPRITCNGFVIDSDSAADVLVEIPSGIFAAVRPSDWIRGMYALDGKMKDDLGTTVGNFSGAGSHLYSALMRGPLIDGAIFFPDPTTDPNWYGDTSAAIYGSGTAGSRVLLMQAYEANALSTGATQRLRLGTQSSYRWQVSDLAFMPVLDNTYSLGTLSLRASVVYAATGAINTSDGREKQQVRELSIAERAVAVRLKGLLRAFKFNDAVEKKGDAARTHFGVIAQDVVAAFAAEGLDATTYALLCYDEWDATPEEPEVRDEKDNLISHAVPAREAGSRYGVRYEELLAFVLAAL